jgi:hypothetical protein
MAGGNEQRFTNKLFKLRRGWGFGIVDGDGIMDLGRISNATARRETTSDPLTEIHGDNEVMVLSAGGTENVQLAGQYHEPLNSPLRSYLMADGEAPTIVNYETLRRVAVLGALLNDDDDGNPQEYVPVVEGIPQAHTSALFPPPTSPAAADTASPASTMAADDYYLWIVPITVDQDVAHGFSAKTNAQILAILNAGTWNRGAEYVPHTPSASASVTLTLNHSIDVTWTEPTTGPRPTHYVIVMGTADDIEDTASHIVGVVAYGTAAINIAAVGTVDWGDDPAVGDTACVESIGVTSEVRTFTALTLTTDYTFDKTTGALKRVDGGAISDGEPVRINVWVFAEESETITGGGSVINENYKHVRFWLMRPTGTDPDTRRGRGLILDCPRVNIAKLAQDLLTGNDDGWHNPGGFSLVALFDGAKGYSYKFIGYDKSYANAIDWYSNDITPKNA